MRHKSPQRVNYAACGGFKCCIFDFLETFMPHWELTKIDFKINFKIDFGSTLAEAANSTLKSTLCSIGRTTGLKAPGPSQRKKAPPRREQVSRCVEYAFSVTVPGRCSSPPFYPPGCPRKSRRPAKPRTVPRSLGGGTAGVRLTP